MVYMKLSQAGISVTKRLFFTLVTGDSQVVIKMTITFINDLIP